MAEVTHPSTGIGVVENRAITRLKTDPRYQAYEILHWGFVVAPTLAGIDKFARVLTDWDKYLAPSIARLLPFSGHAFMKAVGVVEIVAGLVVALKPKVGGYVVAAWLAGIIVDLCIRGGFFDVALRDLGLLLGALALARLSASYDHAFER